MTTTLLAPPVDDAAHRQFLGVTAALLDPVDELTRRRLFSGAAALGAWTVLGGCASSAVPPSPGVAPDPVTVDHKYGSTVVPADPRRVVSVGFADHDALLALGVVPLAVGVGVQSSLQRSGVWPWAHDRLGDARPEVLDYPELNVEAIAALAPDLITGFTSGMTEAEYGLLSRVAPTVAQLPGFPDYFAPWQEVAAAAGRALARPADAQQLIDAVEERFAAARREHPEFDGAAAAYAGVLDGGGFYTENARSPRVAILTALGFTIPTEIDALAEDGGSYAEISEERLALLDREVLVWETGNPVARAAVEGSAVYRQLAVAGEGRGVFVGDELLAAAMGYISVLSLPTVLDLLVPMLAAAIDGDPTTEVSS